MSNNNLGSGRGGASPLRRRHFFNQHLRRITHPRLQRLQHPTIHRRTGLRNILLRRSRLRPTNPPTRLPRLRSKRPRHLLHHVYQFRHFVSSRRHHWWIIRLKRGIGTNPLLPMEGQTKLCFEPLRSSRQRPRQHDGSLGHHVLIIRRSCR